MQKIISISLAVLMLVQTFNPLYQVVYYQLNKEFIAEVLCINKDKPQLQCHGKCYLAKKIKESKQKQHEKQSPKKENTSGIEFTFTEAFHIRPRENYEKTNTPIVRTLNPCLIFNRLFRPPR